MAIVPFTRFIYLMPAGECIFPGPIVDSDHNMKWVVGVATDAKDMSNHLLLVDAQSAKLELSKPIQGDVNDLLKNCDTTQLGVPHLELFEGNPYWTFDGKQ